ncbi:MAG: hypothetical protein K2G13_08230, partial [Muribaculaceae bacterium]|nr:hypothetical protein [Muribaculaceae bacterium]
MTSDMQTKNKPSGWLKLFLVLSISCGILITLYSLLWLANDLPIGVGFLCCGTFMTIFGCCAWSAYKKGLPKALSFSKGCIATFFLLIIFVLCYRFLDGIIYHKVSFTSAFIIVVLFFTGMWCGAWLLFLLNSKQVKRLVADSASGGSKTVKTSIAILVICLIVSSATFYIKESNVHHAREMRYLADQLKAAQEGLDDVEEEDFEEDDSESTADYSRRIYQTAKTAKVTPASKSTGGSRKTGISKTGNVSNKAYANNKSYEESHTKPCTYCNS